MHPLAILGLILIVACLLAAAFSLHKLPTPTRAPAMPPPAPPSIRSDLSCFVRGLILDLQDNPDGWTRNMVIYGRGYMYSRHGVTLHLDTRIMRIAHELAPRRASVAVPATELTGAEQAALSITLSKLCDEQVAKENARAEKTIKEYYAEAARQDIETRARFERLGCPTKNP